MKLLWGRGGGRALKNVELILILKGHTILPKFSFDRRLIN
jgi:hypothetical protein